MIYMCFFNVRNSSVGYTTNTFNLYTVTESIMFYYLRLNASLLHLNWQ